MNRSNSLFDDYFASEEDALSPFLSPSSRKWAKNLLLKVAFLSTFFLICGFTFSFFQKDFSYFFLGCVYFLSGTTALIRSFDDLKKFQINIDTLMTLAAFLAALIGSPLEGALLLVLFALSGAMEEAVSAKTKSTLRELHELTPHQAHVYTSEKKLILKNLKDVQVGELVLVKAGEVVPLDGIVVEGISQLNLVHLTGESLPVLKKENDEVYAGSRNLEGALTVKITKTNQESSLAQIIELISVASAAKPKLQKLLDRIGKPYATIVIGLSLLFALSLPFILPLPFMGVEGSIYRALAFLIAASPCALIIATPTAYLSAINSCAKKGIILKGGIVLDALAQCTIIAFDKTGTLTTGELTCCSIEALTSTSWNLDQALQIAASLEKHANHPIATAICQSAQAKNLDLLPVENFRILPGKGVEGTIEVNQKKYSASLGHALFVEVDTTHKEGFITAFLKLDESIFSFHFTDKMRSGIKEVIHALKKENIKLALLTGDLPQNALHLQQQLNIETCFASLTPQEKLHKISLLMNEGFLAMVGDGINDAPSLAKAHVGISLGKIGSQTAIDASDIVFLNDDLSNLPWLWKKAKATRRIIKQNLIVALGVIICATTPALLGFIPLWLAVILHEGGTLLVGLNSLRLLKK